MKNIAIILAAGSSTRCGFDKLFSDQFGTPVIERTLEVFEKCPEIDEIVLVVNKDQFQNSKLKIKNSKLRKIKDVIIGGTERFESLVKAIEFLTASLTPPFKGEKNARILVHNGANPFIPTEEITKAIKLAEKKKNVIFGFFSPNSIKKVQKGKVVDFLDREAIFETQTPQISDLETFSRAIQHVNQGIHSSAPLPRDEAELLAQIGEEIHVYECSTKNQKITFPSDFPQYDLSFRIVQNPDAEAENLRIGIGEDSHKFRPQFDPEKPITLGGIKFSNCTKSFEANSDGDVIFHALCNAILSSVGEKTLAEFSDEMCKSGITDSAKYVEKSLEIAKSKFPNFQIQNVAISLECKIPKIAPVHDRIQENVAQILNLKKEQIGLTYTSGEALTGFGRGNGVRCLVEILISF